MKEINEKLEKASEIYAENTYIRALVNAIPYIGGSLDTLFYSKGQKILEERILILLKNLKEDIELTEEKMVKKDFIDTEEFFDLIVKAINASTKTKSKEKIKLYSKVLKGSLTLEHTNEYDPYTYLTIIEELSFKEIEVARCLYELKEIRKYKYQDGLTNDAQILSKEYTNLQIDELPFLLLRVEKSGLIKEKVGSFLGYGGGQYEITDVFKKLMKFLSES